MQVIDPLHVPTVPQPGPPKKTQKAIKLRVKFSCELFHFLFIVKILVGKFQLGVVQDQLLISPLQYLLIFFFSGGTGNQDPETLLLNPITEPYYCKPHTP